MSFYPPKVGDRFHSPRHAGRSESETGVRAVGIGATFVCGAVLRFTLHIDSSTKEILEVKFQTGGCGYAMAAADVLADAIAGKSLTELHGLENDFLQRQVEAELGVFAANRTHCLTLAFDALHQAFADWRRRQIEEFTGEKALICTCFGVSEETIENVVKIESAETIEEVTAACGAGGGCGSCQPLIQEIIDVYRREEF